MVLVLVVTLVLPVTSYAQVNNQVLIQQLLQQVSQLQEELTRLLAEQQAKQNQNRQPIRLLSPKNGETFYRGGNTALSWDGGYVISNTEPSNQSFDIYISPAKKQSSLQPLAKGFKTKSYYWSIGNSSISKPVSGPVDVGPYIPDGDYKITLCLTGDQKTCRTFDAVFSIKTGMPQKTACTKIPCYFDGKAITNTDGTFDITPGTVSAEYPYKIIVPKSKHLTLNLKASAYPGVPGDVNNLYVIFNNKQIFSKTYTDYNSYKPTHIIELGMVAAGIHYLSVGAEPYPSHGGLDWFEIKESVAKTPDPMADLAITKMVIEPQKDVYSRNEPVKIYTTVKNIGKKTSGSYSLEYENNNFDGGSAQGFPPLEPGKEYVDYRGYSSMSSWSYVGTNRNPAINELIAKLIPSNSELDSNPLNNTFRLKINTVN